MSPSQRVIPRAWPDIPGTSADQHCEVLTAGGWLSLARLAPNVLVSRMRGRLESGHIERLERYARQIAGNAFVFVHDWTLAEQFDTDALWKLRGCGSRGDSTWMFASSHPELRRCVGEMITDRGDRVQLYGTEPELRRAYAVTLAAYAGSSRAPSSTTSRASAARDPIPSRV